MFRLELNLKRTFTFTNGEVGGEALWAGGGGAGPDPQRASTGRIQGAVNRAVLPEAERFCR